MLLEQHRKKCASPSWSLLYDQKLNVFSPLTYHFLGYSQERYGKNIIGNSNLKTIIYGPVLFMVLFYFSVVHWSLDLLPLNIWDSKFHVFCLEESIMLMEDDLFKVKIYSVLKSVKGTASSTVVKVCIHADRIYGFVKKQFCLECIWIDWTGVRLVMVLLIAKLVDEPMENRFWKVFYYGKVITIIHKNKSYEDSYEFVCLLPIQGILSFCGNWTIC